MTANTSNQPQGVVLYRFNVLHRLMHLIVMIGITGLAVTGFSLKFSAHDLAKAVIWIFGGAEAAGTWHRSFAVATYFGVIVYVIWFAYYKKVLGGRLIGPNSILFNRQDLGDFLMHVRWIIGEKSFPRFGRFAYWEKADFWAIFLGMNTMGLTGLVLWFPEWFTGVLPGWFVNLAGLLHLYEAILAVAIKFVVHIVVAHFRPEVWPMDKSIFNGRTTEERIRHEHPAEADELFGAPGTTTTGTSKTS